MQHRISVTHFCTAHVAATPWIRSYVLYTHVDPSVFVSELHLLKPTQCWYNDLIRIRTVFRWLCITPFVFILRNISVLDNCWIWVHTAFEGYYKQKF
jgi:hypothetical protein